MHIHEAAEMAASKGKCMTRKSVMEETNGKLLNVKPTNTSECCILIDRTKRRPGGSARWWNPTLEDLTADDWIVIDLQTT